MGNTGNVIDWECENMITGLHHTQITVPKGMETAARDFYCGLLGLRELEKPKSLQGRGGLWLQVGQQEVHIGTEDGVERNRTKAHIAYEVENIVAIEKKLSDAGIEMLDSIPIPEYERFEIRDPFGNRVEFIKRTHETKEL